MQGKSYSPLFIRARELSATRGGLVEVERPGAGQGLRVPARGRDAAVLAPDPVPGLADLPERRSVCGPGRAVACSPRKKASTDGAPCLRSLRSLCVPTCSRVSGAPERQGHALRAKKDHTGALHLQHGVVEAVVPGQHEEVPANGPRGTEHQGRRAVFFFERS